MEYFRKMGITETDLYIGAFEFPEHERGDVLRIVFPEVKVFREFYKELPLPMLSVVLGIGLIDLFGIDNVIFESSSGINGISGEMVFRGGIIFSDDMEQSVIINTVRFKHPLGDDSWYNLALFPRQVGGSEDFGEGVIKG